MAFIAPVIAAVGGASSALGIGASLLGAVGSIAQGSAAQQAQEFNARVLQMQATTAENQAASASSNQIGKTRAKVGTGIASGGDAGLDFSGSFRDIISNTDAFGHLDALNEIYKGNVAATGYRNQASADIYAGDQSMTSGIIGAGTNLMKGLANVYRTPGSLDL